MRNDVACGFQAASRLVTGLDRTFQIGTPSNRRPELEQAPTAEAPALVFAEAGFIVITSLISPYRRERDMARSIALAFFQELGTVQP